MSLEGVLRQIECAGLELKVVNGNIHAQPKDRITDEIRNLIRTHKNDLIKRLQATLLETFLDDIEERAAILQFDAPDIYKTRESAISAAYEMCRAAYLNRGKA